MQEVIKIIPINAEIYPAFYTLVQSTQWGNPLLPIEYNNKLWGDVIYRNDEIIGGWVGLIRGDIPVARIITKSVYFDSYPIFKTKTLEEQCLPILVNNIKNHAKKDRVVMLNLTHWVRGGQSITDINETNATFLNSLQYTEEELWKNIERTQRNKIRKGEKNNVEVLVLQNDKSLKYLNDFQLLRQKTQRHALLNNSNASMLLKANEYFENLFKDSKTTLFVAIVDGKTASVALMLHSGNTVYYYSGGSDYELNKATGASAYLIWKALCFYREKKVISFDMGGVPVNPGSNHPAYGVYTFKKSFGGEYKEFEGGKIIIAPFRYNLLQFLLSQRKLLRFFSTKL